MFLETRKERMKRQRGTKATKKGHISSLNRPIQLLYPLEAPQAKEDSPEIEPAECSHTLQDCNLDDDPPIQEPIVSAKQDTPSWSPTTHYSKEETMSVDSRIDEFMMEW